MVQQFDAKTMAGYGLVISRGKSIISALRERSSLQKCERHPHFHNTPPVASLRWRGQGREGGWVGGDAACWKVDARK